MDKPLDYNAKKESNMSSNRNQNNDDFKLHPRSNSMDAKTLANVLESSYNNTSNTVTRENKRKRRNSILGNILKKNTSSASSVDEDNKDETSGGGGGGSCPNVVDLTVLKHKSSNRTSKGLEVYSRDHEEMMKMLRDIDRNTNSTHQLVIHLAHIQKMMDREDRGKKNSNYDYPSFFTSTNDIKMQRVPNGGEGGEESIEYYTQESSCCIII